MNYVRTGRRVFSMLSLRFRDAALVISLIGVYAALEGFGIGLLLPILQYVESGGDTLPSGGLWRFLDMFSEATRIPVNLGTLLLLAFVPILLRQGVYYMGMWASALIQNRAVERLMVRAFSSVMHAELLFIEDQDQGELLSLITTQAGRCGQALMQLVKITSSVAVIVVYTAMLVSLAWQPAVFAAVAMVGVSFALKQILTKSRAYGTAATKTSLALSAAVRERLAATRLVKMRVREDAESREVGVHAHALSIANTRIALGSARIEVIVDPALMAVLLIVVYIGVKGFAMTLASLGLFMFILLRLNAQAKTLNVSRQSLASVMPSFDYVEGVLNKSGAVPTPRGGNREFKGLQREILFEDVRFAYGDGVEVLKGVSLVVRKGSMTAFVGRSGAGKSTLVDIIPLLRRPTGGKLLFDGVPAEEFKLETLRKHIGFLTQEPILFNDTIYRNLTYGLDEEPTDEQVRAALEGSYCSEFIDQLPEGLDTQIGDRGVRFSGGQRQRLALARVLMQSPDILILDEPTSALDSESEQYIQKALEQIAVERTVIVIAHRLATVEKADQIVVLQDGCIAEIGTHSELLACDHGHYRRLFDMQIHA